MNNIDIPTLLMVSIQGGEFNRKSEIRFRRQLGLNIKQYGEVLTILLAKEYIEFAGKETRLTAKGREYIKSFEKFYNGKSLDEINEILERIDENKKRIILDAENKISVQDLIDLISSFKNWR